MAFVRFPVRNVTWSAWPDSFASSEAVERGFCRNCGTPLTYHRIGGPSISLTLNSFDDPDRVGSPEVSLAPERKAAWLSCIDDLPTDE